MTEREILARKIELKGQCQQLFNEQMDADIRDLEDQLKALDKKEADREEEQAQVNG